MPEPPSSWDHRCTPLYLTSHLWNRVLILVVRYINSNISRKVVCFIFLLVGLFNWDLISVVLHVLSQYHLPSASVAPRPSCTSADSNHICTVPCSLRSLFSLASSDWKSSSVWIKDWLNKSPQVSFSYSQWKGSGWLAGPVVWSLHDLICRLGYRFSCQFKGTCSFSMKGRDWPLDESVRTTVEGL